MRLTRIQLDDATVVAREEGDHYVALPFNDFNTLFAQDDWQEKAALDGPHVLISEAVLAKTLEPRQVFCIGLNYKGHIQETGKPTPAFPTIFAKFASTLTAPNADLPYTGVSSELDWEVELGIVIGRTAKNVSQEQAREHIAGYTVVNDISMRDWQNRTNQWFQGKNFEASTPVGPCIVTADEVDHASDLRITCTIGDEVLQDGRTSDLLFGPEELIAYISQFTALLPGDLILTGTPSGVGNAMNPKRFLQVGEILHSEIEGIGKISNRVSLMGQ